MLKTKDGYAKVIGTSYQGSSDYLLLSNGDSKAISSLSVNYANNADKLDGEHASSFVRAGHYESSDLNKLDTYSFIRSVNSNNKDTSPKGNTGWYNVIQLVHRNGEADGPGYIGQIALGMTTNTDDMFFRGKRTDSWKTVIHSGNIADQSVKYATNAGNADTLDGTHLNGIFTAFGNNEHNITATIGGITKKFLVNYASDADKLDGYHANTGQTPYGYIPTIGINGVMEIGKYIDFHNDNGGKYDYSTRLQSTGDHQNTLNLPSKSGTLALTSDIKDTNTWRPITDNYKLGKSDTSLSSLGSLTLYNDLLGAIPTIPTIPNPTDYYWANNKISSTSKIDAIVQVNSIGAGCSTVFGSQQDGTVAATNWFRAVGKTGIYFQTYTGGLYMTDTSWVRTFNNKGLCIKNTVKSNDLQVMYKGDETVATSAAVLESATTLVYGTSTSSNSINTYLRGTNITLQVKKDTSINYNAFQVTANRIYCNNYCNMKVGATVSDGDFTVQNDSYLAQKAGAKVGIGTSVPFSTLDVEGRDEVPIRVNGGIKLSTKESDPSMGYTVYFTQPVCIAVGKYISQEKSITCSGNSGAHIVNNRIFRMTFDGKLLEKTSDMWVFPIIHTDTDSKCDYTYGTNQYGELQLDIRWHTDIPDFTFMIYRSPFDMYKDTVREY